MFTNGQVYTKFELNNSYFLSLRLFATWQQLGRHAWEDSAYYDGELRNRNMLALATELGFFSRPLLRPFFPYFYPSKSSDPDATTRSLFFHAHSTRIMTNLA
jgi:hypothetical protein